MRRSKPEKREVLPDVRYNSVHVQTLVKHVLKQGKKSLAVSLVYDAMDLIGERTGKSAIDVFDTALKNVSPAMEVRPRRVGGATYQIPVEVRPDRSMALAMRWLVDSAKKRSEKNMGLRLAGELMDASENRGSAIKKREDTHKMAEANRAFSHFRW